MTDTTEYAEMYTFPERLRIMAIGLVVGGLTIALGKLWFFPWLHEFAMSSPCRSTLGIRDSVLLFHGLFIGIPLSSAILTAVTLGRCGCKILRHGQVPPRNEKVFRPTRIVRGVKARLHGYAHVLAAVPFIVLAVWGNTTAQEAEGRGPVCLSAASARIASTVR